ncbi:MAG: long-chain fatty acid--CoA ligase [Actinomyces succiniciruminis]|uniref:Long-chain-fatty-acid--CoA ligase FadD15 n=1 Tax=Actinomyces succiniciruminis TaxID=1522002 RepID=A0A1L7RC45_9ACTO|nr:AMP-dependent synthetase/ligase [Actinomyces succiniciruminis]MBE6474148.1 long-chain fatty acid--CoA ligase [Actinomyces succiniciruminis]MBM6978871.1 long-chain fatty acid--CoA ligase [Actinomyces succiniciruminis]CED91471.1 Long-chain-fatty-acid--CoA ligase FadD15 [Actinomyces succiniciruminis]
MSTGVPSEAGSPTAVDGVAVSPLIKEPESDWTVPWLLADRIARTPNATLIERKTQLGNSWVKVTARTFGEDVARVASGLIGMGLEPGASVGIMAHTSYEWTLLDMAIARAGLVSVPIYETDSAEQVEWILADADVRLVVTESAVLAELVRGAAAAYASAQPDAAVKVLSLDHDAISTIVEAGRGVLREELESRSAALTCDDVYSIIYTSGTTGRPKGVEITHRQAAGLGWNGVRWIPELLNSPDTRLLLFLPLAHAYARFLQLLAIAGNGVLGHTPDVKTLLPDLQGFAPSYVLAVPRVMEKIYNAADAKAGSGVKLRTFRWAAKVAIAYSRALDTPEGPSRQLRAAHALADQLVYRTIRALLGPNARYAISGGGPLGERLGHFYRGIGLVILEGYGLTETIGPTAVNLDIRNKIGTVGPPVCGNRVRVGADGELEVTGLGVFSRYHNNPEATAEAFTDDGWFRTGDIGSVDADGWVRITGRKKELIVTAGGKNVAPNILEDRLRGHPLVSQVLVIGDGEPFISALVTLDKEMLPQWLANHNLPEMDVTTASTHPQVLAALDRAVARTNRAVSRAESIRTYRVLTSDFTEANGLLTPSLKVKRSLVMETYADTIADIYSTTKKGPQE